MQQLQWIYYSGEQKIGKLISRTELSSTSTSARNSDFWNPNGTLCSHFTGKWWIHSNGDVTYHQLQWHPSMAWPPKSYLNETCSFIATPLFLYWFPTSLVWKPCPWGVTDPLQCSWSVGVIGKLWGIFPASRASNPCCSGQCHCCLHWHGLGEFSL